MEKRERLIMILIPVCFIILCCGGVLSGCSTIEGIGRDLQKSAQWTQEKIDNGFDSRPE